MKKDRLERLADKCEGVGAYTKTGPIPRKLFDMNFVLDKRPCGSVGCLMGHAGADPWFRRRGLKIDSRDDGPFALTLDGVSMCYENAARDFFDITWSDALDLFSSCAEHRTPKQAAKAIRAFIAKKEKASAAQG